MKKSKKLSFESIKTFSNLDEKEQTKISGGSGEVTPTYIGLNGDYVCEHGSMIIW